MHPWLRPFRRLIRVSPRPAARRRPAVEQLEDRRVPATGFTQLDLVADQASTALITDGSLVDAWGVAVNPTGGNFWVADNRTSVATFYGGDVAGSPFVKDPLTVQILFDHPSGAVLNTTGSFGLQNGKPAEFVVSQETAWVSAWNPGPPTPTTADAPIDTSFTGPHVYEGVAIAQSGAANQLYLTNIHSRAIEVFDGSFRPVTLPAGSFTDPNLPTGYSPFNIANFGGQLYVTYAVQNATQDGDQPGPGNGLVDVFNPDGTFVKRLVSNGTGSPLNSPWGLAIAPAGFGNLGGDLLVGNFGDGQINAFDPNTGTFVATLADGAGNPIVIDGLWGLQFGNGHTAGDAGTLYFAAGPAGESHGLFGSLHANGTGPLVGAATAVSGTAGQPLSGVLATFADANPALTATDFTVTITVNGQTSAGAVAPGGTGFLVTGPSTSPPGGTLPVTITIQEKANPANTLTLTGSASVTGSPLAGVGPANPTVTTAEGTAFNGNLVSFSDSNPNAQATDFTASIAWGNNTNNTGTVVKNADGTFTVQGTNPAPEDGTFPGTVTVRDNAGNTLPLTFTLQVTEPSVSGSGQPLSVGSNGQVSNATVATFSHGSGAEPASAFTATIDWGDHTTASTGAVSEANNVYTAVASHSYATSGSFPVTVTVSDDGVATVFHMTATVAAPAPPPSGGPGPGGTTTTFGDRFVLRAVEDLLGQAPSAQTLQQFAGQLDGGAGVQAVVLAMIRSFGPSFRAREKQLIGAGSPVRRADNLILHLLGRPASKATDASLLKALKKKLAGKGKEDQAIALVLSSPQYSAKVS